MTSSVFGEKRVMHTINIRTTPPRMVVGRGYTELQSWNVTHAFNQAVLREIRDFAKTQELSALADFDAAAVMEKLPIVFLSCTEEFFDALNKAKLPGIKPWPRTYGEKTFTP